MNKGIWVGIVMGSDSDLETMQEATKTLEKLILVTGSMLFLPIAHPKEPMNTLWVQKTGASKSLSLPREEQLI